MSFSPSRVSFTATVGFVLIIVAVVLVAFGIPAVWFSGAGAVEPEPVLRKAADTLASRGPDGSGERVVDGGPDDVGHLAWVDLEDVVTGFREALVKEIELIDNLKESK